jgi:hypothetical protein
MLRLPPSRIEIKQEDAKELALLKAKAKDAANADKPKPQQDPRSVAARIGLNK